MIKLFRFLLLFLVFPILSVKVEIMNIYSEYETVDGFNLLYTLFRWPTWWIIDLLEIKLFDSIINKN